MSALTTSSPVQELLLQATTSEEALYSSQLSFFSEKRKEAAAEFAKLGFPTTRNEEWKYTSLNPALKHQLRLAHPEEPQILDRNTISELLSAEGITVIIENGRLNKAASNLDKVPSGITIDSFAALQHDTRLVNHLGQYAALKNEAMVALNTALLTDGVAIFVDAKANISEKIHILVITTSASALVVQPRILVALAKNASCTITERHVTYGEVLPHFTNIVSETYGESNSHLNYVKLQDTDDAAAQVNFHQAWLEGDSSLHITTLSLNGALIRNNLHIRLNGQNCNAHLNGLYVVDGHQLVDNHSLVDHAFPNCYSNELYKGIIDDHGQGVFNGKIFVRQDAQKTNAYQSNKNLLLSNHASMNAKPQLEIYADDVKCSHGATTGQMDDEALFYLRARGIGEASARALLNHAFAADVIEQIPDESVRQEMLERLDSKLEQ